MKTVTLKLSDDLKERVDREKKEKGISKRHTIEVALREHFNHMDKAGV